MEHLLFQGELPLVVFQQHDVSCSVMVYHEYRNTWTPIVGEVLQCLMELANDVDQLDKVFKNGPSKIF